ncbi:hypothetical protein BDA99DRAFT_41153 [Phascolomyces articulosus]|uniref:histidine kinase n=1 Tax=Phascolomyces articulosus TaxID=60185 RepID=A0AAD5KFR1_9FUNG|nr:hypothetical protein BDA99DRAFT_41153 [Phascolomyces articulosus]
MSSEHPSSLPLLNNSDMDSPSCGSPRSICSPATTQYHAQLYSGQQQLQKRLQQQQQQQQQKDQHVIGSSVMDNNSNNNNSIPSLPQQLTFVPPNLYRTSLQLATELDIHAWWSTLIDILTGSSFHAIRVCLSVPQDMSDAWTGAWGLKAAWSKAGVIRTTPPSIQPQQDLSSQQEQPSSYSNERDYFIHTHSHNNDDLHDDSFHHHDARHKCFDRLQSLDYESEPLINNPSAHRIIRRNTTIILSREYRPRSSQRPPLHFQHHHHDDSRDMFKRALLEHSEKCTTTRRVTCHSALAATSPRLIQDGTMMTGNATTATTTGADGVDFRSTEILADSPRIEHDNHHSMMTSSSCTTEFHESGTANVLYDYDEYEQQQPSPWSQSPAPSPAMMDPDVNPFFQSTPGIDDEAFNPASPESYQSSNIPFPPPASNVHSVIHIPLVHSPTSSSTTTHDEFNSSSATTTTTTPSTMDPSQQPQHAMTKNPPAPIAILSFLSPVVPYPSNLVSSLNALAPFIASSCSNALEHSRHHNLIRRSSARRRPSMKQQRSRKKSGDDILRVNGQQQQEMVDYSSSATTPNATSPSYQHGGTAVNPTFLGSMSNFTKNSLETVTEQKPEDDPRLWSASSMSSYRSAFSVQPTTNSLELQQEPPRRISEEGVNEGQVLSRSSSISSERALSPSSMAILDTWGSPNHHKHQDHMEPSTTTPPPTTATTSSSSTLMINDEEINLMNDQEDMVHSQKEQQQEQRSRKRTVTRRLRPRSRTRVRWRAYGSGNSASSPGRSIDKSNDSGSMKDGIEHLFVAPKSSLLRLVIDGIPIHVFTCSTTTGQVTWVNNRILQYTGRSLSEHLGPGWLSHMHPDDQTVCHKAWENAFEQGNGFAGEYRLRRFDGVYRFFLWRIVPLRDLKGRIIHWFGTCTDVHDQHIAKESTIRQMEIESNERKYRLLAEAIPQIVFTFSPGTGVTYANEKWESYSGLEFDRTKGFGFMSQVHPDDRHKLQLPDLLPRKTAGVIWQSEIRLSGHEGEYRWFLVKSISVDELDTGDVRWFGTCTDINDHKLLEHKLKEAHDAAQKSMESKTRFLSNMSHEIRTPLIGITGMLNFLLDTELTPEQLDYAHTIQQSAESLLVVINDILDLSKVEAGMMKLEWEPFSLVTMIEDANELLSTLAIQKGLELSFWVDEDVPDVVVGDRVRLRQVLLNLIGNAIKFTTEGEIFTQCTVQEISAESNELTLLFEVVDTGSGFDADGEAVMFKPFSQVDSSSTRKHGGSGLGLVISRQLIELHGGTMQCKSKKGEGSTFYFTVKFSIPPPQTRPRPQTPQNETNSNPFFRTSVCSVSQAASPVQPSPASNLASSSSSSSASSVFVPSPLAHSKKHSQAADLPSSMELLQDALLNKAASMRLMPPPARNGIRQSLSATTATTKNKTAALATTAAAASGEKSSSSLKPPSSLTIAPHLGLLSPNAGVILPPRTPSRGSPLRILAVSDWHHARNTIVKHLRAILSGISQHQDYELSVATNHIEAVQLLAYPQAAAYDYIVINLALDQQVLDITRVVTGALQHQDANVLVITTPMQRSLIMESAKGRESELLPSNCSFVFKPIKRSKLNWYFGLHHQQDDHLSTNTGGGEQDPSQPNGAPNMKAAAAAAAGAPESSRQRVATQKEVFRRMEADVGGKGFRVMLVEDNLVNQKVLTRYLERVGLNVEVASDGDECVKLFHSQPPGYFSLILCDLFMPVKDGYEATREIREWEKEHTEQTPVPIVALSANVMSDVAQKCLESGFSTYISKPVNFATLSDVIRKHLLPKH